MRNRATSPNNLPRDIEKILGALTNLFAEDGDTQAVAILALSTATIEETDYDGIDGGQWGYTIYLQLPENLYHQISKDASDIELTFRDKASTIARLYDSEWIARFVLSTRLESDPEWREKATAWVSGQGITNQGRARSDNIAPRLCDGLLFRSQPEINLYRAFKSLGVSFAPLPVFVRGGETYRRIEPDFVVLKDGLIMIVEVDGDTVHKETPLEAHNRTTMLAHEGAHIERVNANDCSSADKAMACARRLLEILQKLKTSR